MKIQNSKFKIQNSKILVTGGTGYIGSHTVVELIEKGYNVVIVDALFNSTIEVLDRIKKITGIKPSFEKLDLCDFAKTCNFYKNNQGIKAIIHFAGFKAVGESVEKPLMYYQNNILSTVNLLKCIESFNLQNIGFVFSSSCTVYGEPDRLPVDEMTPVKPALSPYGNTKRIQEEILFDMSKVFDINVISLRYFNPIGAHKSALIGELPIGVPNNLVPYITQTAIGKHKYLRVFGNDYNTPDGTCIRDYIHVTDLAKAHVVAIERILNNENKDKFEVFNLGTGRGYSVLEVVKTFEKVSGMKLNYKIVDRRDGDIEKIWADPTKANKELGWKAEKTLEDMLLSAWEWEKNIQ